MTDWIEPFLLAGTVAVAAQTIVLVLFALIHRGLEGVWYWVAGMGCFATMMGLYLLRADNWFLEGSDFRTLFLSVWLANVFLLSAWLTYTTGIHLFLGLRAPGRLQLSFFFVIFVLLTYHTFVDPRMGWRSSWVSLYITINAFLTAVLLIRHAEQEIRFTSRTVSGVFIVVGCLFLARFGVTMADNFAGDSGNIFQHGKWLFLGVPVFSSLWVFTLLLMIHQRQQASMMRLYRKEIEIERARQRDRQRLRLARDLHDGLSGMITSMRWIAENQLSGRNSDDKTMRTALEKIHWLARESNEEVRMLLNKLENPSITATKWLADWRQYAFSVAELNGLEMEWKATGFLEQSLGDSLAAVCLWRVLKEALQNACQHSGANRVCLTHSILDGRMRIIVGDDGKGYILEQHAGRGMRNIKERLSDLGGTFELSNAPGLHISLEVPLPMTLRSAPVADLSEEMTSLETVL